MITGINTVHEHEGRQYHLQAEDQGAGKACFSVRVYDGGTVLWNKQISYQAILDQGLDQVALSDEVHALMRKTLATVQAAIAKGKIG